jgi:hypothetical protein
MRAAAAFLAALLLPLTACSDKGGDSAASGDDDEQIAADLWAAMDGYEGWNQTADWTGIQPSEDGTHGAFVQIWFNDPASDTLMAAAGGEMQDGAILVKEGYADETGSEVSGLTAMQKLDGYDEAGGDWFWAKFTPGTGAVETAGVVSGCAGCHSSGQDSVRFETW